MSNRLNVFLDLDNTIISSIPSEEFPFSIDNISSHSDKFPLYNMDNLYIVFERPHTQEFLDHLFDNFDVSVWTAASKSYAIFIIDKVIYRKKNRKLKYILHGAHSKQSQQRFGTPKQLDILWKDYKLQGVYKDNTIIIDDLKGVKSPQPCNCIRVKAFEIFTSTEPDKIIEEIKQSLNDDELIKVKDKLDNIDLKSVCLIK